MIEKPKYHINEKVYHITPESQQGIIIDINYSYLTKLHQYQVTFGPDTNPGWYFEHELSKSKVFN